MQFAHADIAGYRWTVNPKDKYIGTSLLTYGEWSFGEISFLTRLVSIDASIVEVGGNVGAHTVPLARHVAAGRVITFEAQRICFQLLCANLVNNDCVNVGAYNMAAGAVPGRAQVPDIHPDQAFNFGGIGVRLETFEPVTTPVLGKTPVVRLDDVIGSFRVDLLKCDAEGMEADVVRGAAGLIERDKPLLYLEDDRPELSRELYDLVRGFGYDV
ncbi:MAG: FkbM family methyltransferase [Rhodospirillales bacterium]|nr:FkbM family methyltransferase [Rhodospirillales bacterium]